MAIPSERQSAAVGDEFGHRRGFGGYPVGAEPVAEQLVGTRRSEHGEGYGAGGMGGDKSGEPAAAGDEHRAPWAARQQRRDLLGVNGVVLHDYSGVPARFLEARDRIVEAAHEMHASLAPWVGHPMTHENGRQFVQMLVYGSQQARGLLSHLTEHAEHAFNELVTQLSAANDTAAVASAVSTVLEHADRLFHGGDVPLEHTVTTEMAAWLEVGTSTRDANELHAARDQVVAAAHEFAGSLRPYLHRLVDESTRAHLLHPLVHTATQARNHIRHH